MISGKAVLLVDDDESIRTSLTYFFRKKTRAFLALPSAESALDLLKKETDWDAVISDFKLPGMDGIAFLKEVKKHVPKMKTALITAYANVDIVTEALRAGVHDFIQKPFKATMIAEALRRMGSECPDGQEAVVLHADDDEPGKDECWREDLEFTIQKVTHQMNNAFTALRGKAELGLRKPPESGDSAKFVEILDILTSVEALNKELMSFGKALTPRPFTDLDVMALIRRRSFDHAAMLHNTGVRLQIKNAEGGPFLVTTCEDPLIHVLDNILINAIQGVAEVKNREKEIIVTAVPQGTHMRVQVTDNGVGMDPETLSRACRSGFTTKPDGNGLGLFITKRLCQIIKAELHLESQAGNGTTVTLRLPCAPSAESARSIEGQSAVAVEAMG